MNVNEETNNKGNLDSVIAVTVSDYVLTSLSCASLVNEIIKNLLYQRSQIPYPHFFLKSIVNKKCRSLHDPQNEEKNNFTLNRHYRTVSASYDTLEVMMINTDNAFVHFGNKLKEVVYVCGVTPFCPKEVFRIRIPPLSRNHCERQLAQSSKKQLKTLRNIFFSQTWMSLSDKPLGCTNTYMFLRADGCMEDVSKSLGDIFVFSTPLTFSSKVKQTVINISWSNDHMCSGCENFEIFQDCSVHESSESTAVEVSSGSGVSDKEIWLQSKVIFQGFKDRFVNQNSASAL